MSPQDKYQQALKDFIQNPWMFFMNDPHDFDARLDVDVIIARVGAWRFSVIWMRVVLLYIERDVIQLRAQRPFVTTHATHVILFLMAIQVVKNSVLGFS